MSFVRIWLLLCLFLTARFAVAQDDSCTLKISLLTCGTGEELYSTFGHSAIRVVDRVNHTDIVFNYGTFEFGPDFYIQFIRGKLPYMLDVQRIEDFMAEYQYEQRSVIEQPLNLSCEEKLALYDSLRINAQPQHRYYKYDFLYDNCSTRILDIVAAKTNDSLVIGDILPAEVPSFRNLLHVYLNRSGQYWSKLGIDILLGAKLDKEVTNRQSMFLPDYLMKGFDSARIAGQPLVSRHNTLLEQSPRPTATPFLMRPVVIFSILLLLIAVLQFWGGKKTAGLLLAFDRLYFFALGAVGILLLFMWFGTEHIVCSNNMNLLWAIPTHLPIAFLLAKKKEWIRKYFRITLIISILLAATWFFIPQQLNYAIVPLLIIIILRSYHYNREND